MVWRSAWRLTRGSLKWPFNWSSIRETSSASRILTSFLTLATLDEALIAGTLRATSSLSSAICNTRCAKNSWRIKFDVGTDPSSKRLTRYVMVKGKRPTDAHPVATCEADGLEAPNRLIAEVGNDLVLGELAVTQRDLALSDGRLAIMLAREGAHAKRSQKSLESR